MHRHVSTNAPPPPTPPQTCLPPNSKVVQHVAALYPQAVMSAIGYSLGGNILVRYLGEEGSGTPIRAAVSLGNPFTLVRWLAHACVMCGMHALCGVRG